MSVEENGNDLASDLAVLDQVAEEKVPIEEVPEDKEVEIPVEESEEPEEEIEGVEEEPKEEEEEDPTDYVHDRPALSKIKEKYPNLFKDFPALRDVYFREREFTDLFPTVQDAREAAENNEAFSTIKAGVMNGNLTDFFTSIKEIGSLDKCVEDLLPTLFTISKEAHWKATEPLMENIVKSMYAKGVNSGDENTANAALVLSNFLFGDTKVASGERVIRQPKEKPQSTEAEKRLSELEANQFLGFRQSVVEVSHTGLKDLVLARGAGNKLKIDPDGVLSKFMVSTLTEKIMEEVEKQLTSDATHMRFMQSLWSKAAKAGYIGDWKSRISSAYLERAKSLVPGIRSRLVAEALGTSSANTDKKTAKVKEINSRREPGSEGRDTKDRRGPVDAKKVDWSKSSDEDILNGTPTLRRS